MSGLGWAESAVSQEGLTCFSLKLHIWVSELTHGGHLTTIQYVVFVCRVPASVCCQPTLCHTRHMKSTYEGDMTTEGKSVVDDCAVFTPAAPVPVLARGGDSIEGNARPFKFALKSALSFFARPSLTLREDRR